MTTSRALIGNEIASFLPKTSEDNTYGSMNLVSLQDLLDALQKDPPKEIAMLRSTATKVAESYRKTCAEVPIEAVDADRDLFRDYLRRRKYPPTSVRSYSNYAGILAKRARNLGWSPSPVAITTDWAPLTQTIRRLKLMPIVRYLIRQGRVPATVQELDFANWIEKEVRRDRSYSRALQVTRSIRVVLVRAGCGAALSQKRLAKKRYGISLAAFPEPLKNEVKDAIQFRQSRYVGSRSKSKPIRAITAESLRQSFCSLYGFAVNIAGLRNISKLSDLVTEEIVGRYVEWALDDRGLQSDALRSKLGLISAALGQNPRYSMITGSWLRNLLSNLSEDSDEHTLRRKEEKFLPYETLRSIPDLMRHERPMASNATPRQIAIWVRNELLMMWPVILPWRQLNIRIMRSGGSDPNLFKASFPKLSSMAKPEWLVGTENQDPGIEVWQIRFNKRETKANHLVEAVLPRCLTPLLEEYLWVHRPHLVKGVDPGTLFLNNHGGPLTSRRLRDLVAQFTLKYGGRIVTPHLFRDVYAFMYLDKVPEDYLTLSKLLWHSNIQTTIRIYGRRFNESAAMCRMEKVLGI